MKGKSASAGEAAHEAGDGDAESEIPFRAKTNSWPIEEGAQRGLSMVTLVLRLTAAMGTLCGALVMATANQTLPFSTQSSQFTANYNDLPTFTFFVIANSIVSGYLFLSLPLSICQMMKVAALTTAIVCFIIDTVAMGVATAGASAGASVLYLAYKGNAAANWLAFCDQFDSFCRRISGSIIASFFAVFALMLLIIVSPAAISRRRS